MMSPSNAYHWFLLGLRTLLAAVFLYAGFVKLVSPQDFADSIASFRLLPASLIDLLALGLPPFEIGTGLLLLLGYWQRAAALSVLGMTTVFALAMISALARGLPVDCGCFGGGTPSLLRTWISLARDLLLIAASAFLYQRTVRHGPPSHSDSSPDKVGTAVPSRP